MKGWLILRHSLRQVFGNMNGALRVSAVPYLIQFVVGVALGVGAMSMGQGAQMGAGMAGGLFVALLLAVICGLWVAVAWHRYVLLGEDSGFIPTFRGDRMWAYFLRSLGYGIILVIVAVIWGMIVGFALGGVIGSNPALGMLLLALLVYLPILVLAFRMTADLPAMALGASSEFMSGWRATEGHTGDIVALAVILILIGVGLEMLALFVFGGMGVLALVWQFIIGWVQMMVAASILTTLYGHYIEKRELV